MITIGILGAFALNNWNENRINRNAQREILSSIKSGLEDAFFKVETIKNDEEQFFYKLRDFLRQPALTDANPSKVFYDVAWAGDEASISIESYVEIQDFDKLPEKNSMIIRGISTIENRIRNIKVNNQDRLVVQQQRIDPYLVSSLSLPSLLNATDSTLQLYELGEFNLSETLNNPEFRNAIALKMSLTMHIVDQYTSLQESIREVITIIDNELNQE